MRLVHSVQSQNHMNTTFVFRVSVPETQRRLADAVLEEAHREVARLENELTEFREVSPVYRLNHARVGERVEFTADGWELWMRSLRLRELTQNAFDPLFRGPGGRMGWDEDARTMWKETENAHLGYGAIGKGFALDKVRGLLERDGLENYVISAGGSSQILSGFAAPEQPWKWGWSWRKEEGRDVGVEFAHVTGRTVALGVSGFHEKGTHIAADTAYQSALVAESRATEADGLSTAFLVRGWDRLEGFEENTALATVDERGEFRWNGVFQKLWGPIAAVFAFCGTAWAEEEALDLSELGFDDFTPYLLERDPIWILLPLLSLFLVGLHLMKPGQPRLGKEKWEKPK